VINALEAAGLTPWFKRMEQLIPLENQPYAIYAIEKDQTVTY